MINYQRQMIKRKQYCIFKLLSKAKNDFHINYLPLIVLSAESAVCLETYKMFNAFAFTKYGKLYWHQPKFTKRICHSNIFMFSNQTKDQKSRKQQQKVGQQQVFKKRYANKNVPNYNQTIQNTSGTFNSLTSYLSIFRRQAIYLVIFCAFLSSVFFIGTLVALQADPFYKDLTIQTTNSASKDHKTTKQQKKLKFFMLKRAAEDQLVGDQALRVFMKEFNKIITIEQKSANSVQISDSQFYKKNKAVCKMYANILRDMAQNMNQSLLDWNRDTKIVKPYQFRFQLIDHKEPLIIHLPKNRVVVSTSLIKLFTTKKAKKEAGKTQQKLCSTKHSNIYFEQLVQLIKLHHFLFFKRFHIQSLSIRSIKELVFGVGIENDLLIREVYSRKYLHKQLSQIVSYGNCVQYQKSSEEKIQTEPNHNKSLSLDKQKLNSAINIIISDYKSKKIQQSSKMSIYSRLSLSQFSSIQKMVN